MSIHTLTSLFVKSKMRFFKFFILSFFLHVILLLALNFYHLPKEAPLKSEVPLFINLQKVHITPTSQEASTVEEKKPDIKPTADKTIKKTYDKSKSNTPIHEASHAIAEKHKETPLLELEEKILQNEPLHVTKNNETMPTLLEQIEKIIAQKKTYPKRAQREGMQGDVLVAFTWTPNGLSDLKIIKPSAHSLLNHYALELIENASKEFPPVSESLDITLPIGFNLL